MVIVAVVGVPLGAIVHNLAPGGLFENRALHTPAVVGHQHRRSLPFLVLMTSIIPVHTLDHRTNIGIPAAVAPMSIAGIAFFTRIVENSLRGVPSSVVAAATAAVGRRSSHPHRTDIRALPSIGGGLTINTIAMIEYSAIAGTIARGGLGYIAVTYGYQRFDHQDDRDHHHPCHHRRRDPGRRRRAGPASLPSSRSGRPDCPRSLISRRLRPEQRFSSSTRTRTGVAVAPSHRRRHP